MSQESHRPAADKSSSDPTSHHPRDIFDEIYGEPEKLLDPISLELEKRARDIRTARDLDLDASVLVCEPNTRGRFPGDIMRLLFGRGAASQNLVEPTVAALREHESKTVGASIFGPMGQNEVQRDFVYYDTDHVDGVPVSTWYYYQRNRDPATRKYKQRTITYEHGRREGIFRSSSHAGTSNAIISGKELDDFNTATKMYHEGVIELYRKRRQARGIGKVSNLTQLPINTPDQTDIEYREAA